MGTPPGNWILKPKMKRPGSPQSSSSSANAERPQAGLSASLSFKNKVKLIKWSQSPSSPRAQLAISAQQVETQRSPSWRTDPRSRSLAPPLPLSMAWSVPGQQTTYLEV